MTGSTHVRVTLALVLAVSLAGCGAVNVPFFGGDDADDGAAEELAVDSVSKMESVSAYNFSMTNTLTFGQNVVNMTADGRINHTTERLFMENGLTIRTNTTRATEFTQVYVVNDTRCVKGGEDGETTWDVSNGSANAWNQGLSLDAQSRILNASGTEATLLENQTVRGEDAYVIRISPDPAAFRSVVAEQNKNVSFANVAVQNATITQYVAQDDKRLLKTEMDVRYRQGDEPRTMQLSMRYSDYGDVDPIKPPKKAKNAGCTANASSSVVA
jgi:outer membrane lipoprotein-sorting protein